MADSIPPLRVERGSRSRHRDARPPGDPQRDRPGDDRRAARAVRRAGGGPGDPHRDRARTASSPRAPTSPSCATAARTTPCEASTRMPFRGSPRCRCRSSRRSTATRSAAAPSSPMPPTSASARPAAPRQPRDGPRDHRRRGRHVASARDRRARAGGRAAAHRPHPRRRRGARVGAALVAPRARRPARRRAPHRRPHRGERPARDPPHQDGAACAARGAHPELELELQAELFETAGEGRAHDRVPREEEAMTDPRASGRPASAPPRRRRARRRPHGRGHRPRVRARRRRRHRRRSRRVGGGRGSRAHRRQPRPIASQLGTHRPHSLEDLAPAVSTATDARRLRRLRRSWSRPCPRIARSSATRSPASRRVLATTPPSPRTPAPSRSTSSRGGSRGPARFLGLHFFNPVPASQLVEIVRRRATDAELVDDARADGSSALGKTPIVVRDAPGFASSRLGVALGARGDPHARGGRRLGRRHRRRDAARVPASDRPAAHDRPRRPRCAPRRSPRSCTPGWASGSRRPSCCGAWSPKGTSAARPAAVLRMERA